MHTLLLTVLLFLAPASQVRFTAAPGVAADLAQSVRAVATDAVAFLVADLGLESTGGPVDVALAADLRKPGITGKNGVSLNARYFLAKRTRARLVEVTAHELTHALANRASRKNMPLWFSEGLAVHQTERFLRRTDAAAADAFARRRLKAALREEPAALDDADFGKSERRRFYGEDHSVHYSGSYAAVRAIAERFGNRILGRLLAACGKGLPRRAKIAERRLRWKRAVREVLGVEPATLDALRDEWLARRAGGEVDSEQR